MYSFLKAFLVLMKLSIYVSVFQFSLSGFVYAEVYLTFVALKEQCISHHPACESSIVFVSRLLPNCKINVCLIVFISPSMEPLCAVPIYISRHAAGAWCGEPLGTTQILRGRPITHGTTLDCPLKLPYFIIKINETFDLKF